ncbi:MAG: peptidoglycan DD-metalloendopeptidase family protein [Gemmatimonadetes bacterium]|nr:peptidoglycan DD-metalloendopeptidase family protein [Gemmatimonadota bacterium]
MRTTQRILSLGVFAAFGVAIAGSFVELQVSPDAVPLPALLPAAHANPAEVGFQDTLRSGETISELLSRAELASSEADALLAELNEFQDPRRLRPGSVISYRKSFETGDVRGMELRIDADRTLNMHRAGSDWAGAIEEVPVKTDSAVLTGTVRSSLYAALIAGDGDGVPASEREGIADLLADRIFAWQVDFSRDLRPGDEFRILYERTVRPDGTARAGRVLGVQFNLNGRDHEAYLYRSADGSEDYYGRDGESLRRAFLRAPLEFRRISSAFARSRFHPVLKKNRPHLGIDYAASAGTPVRAVGDGVVRRANFSDSYGNVVEIGHSRGYASRYAHLRAFASGIRPGTRIRQGDLIGYVGSTGMSTAPHLHYEFHASGKAVDPNTIKSITGEPVPSRYRGDFRARIASQLRALDRASSPVLLADAGSTGKRDGE